MKRLRLCLIGVILLWILAPPCHGYVMPPKQILSLMIRELGSCHTLILRHQIFVHAPGRQEPIQEFEETLYYGEPDRYRSELIGHRLEQLQVVDEHGTLCMMNGRVIEERNACSLFRDLLLYPKTRFLLPRLGQLGINLEVVSLGRFGKKIAYVIGAKYPDESVPQLWIEKDSFRPCRLLLGHGQSHGAAWKEVQFSDYTPLAECKKYPARILLIENGRQNRSYVLEAFRVNPSLPSDLFDVLYLKALYDPGAPARFKPFSHPSLERLRKGEQDARKGSPETEY